MFQSIQSREAVLMKLFQSYSAGLVSLIRRSRDILSEATILKPYRDTVSRAFSSSSGDKITGTPI